MSLSYHTDAFSKKLLWYAYQVIMKGTKIQNLRMRKGIVRKVYTEII